jgi:hypothetical protein
MVCDKVPDHCREAHYSFLNTGVSGTDFTLVVEPETAGWAGSIAARVSPVELGRQNLGRPAIFVRGLVLPTPLLQCVRSTCHHIQQRAFDILERLGIVIWHNYMVWNDVLDDLNDVSDRLPLKHI